MKRILILLVGWLCATGAASAETTSRTMVVSTLGPVNTQWVAHVVGWAVTNLAIPVVVGPSRGAEVTSFEQAIEIGQRKRPAHEIGLVLLVHPSQASDVHGVLRKEAGVALINVSAMQADGAGETVVVQRLERQVIRGLCMLLGLESSPNPYSAMAVYQGLSELDNIGRNLDPPWLVNLQKAAREQGLTVDRESAFYMLN